MGLAEEIYKRAQLRKKQKEAEKESEKIGKQRKDWEENKSDKTKRVEAAQKPKSWMDSYRNKDGSAKKTKYKDGGVCKKGEARKEALRQLLKKRGK